jgi:Na+/alanine symporter
MAFIGGASSFIESSLAQLFKCAIRTASGADLRTICSAV